MEGSAGASSTFRFARVSADDHGGALWIVTILGVIYSSLSTLARIRIKWGLIGIDDYLVVASTFVMYLQSAMVMYGLHHGLSKVNTLTPESEWLITGQMVYISQILSTLVLCFSKCSIIYLILRVFTISFDWRYLVCTATLALGVAYGITAVVVLTVDCDPASMLITFKDDQCQAKSDRWQAITAVDIATELLISLLPVVLIWPSSNNITLWLKFHIFLAFSFRLPLVALASAHLAASEAFQGSTEPQFEVTTALILQQVTLTWSLISTSLPNLTGFLKSFSIGMGVAFAFRRDNSDEHPSQASNSYPLQTLKRSPSKDFMVPTARYDVSIRDEAGESFLRPDRVSHQVVIETGSKTRSDDGYSVSRYGSQDAIIKREIEWEVKSQRKDL